MVYINAKMQKSYNKRRGYSRWEVFSRRQRRRRPVFSKRYNDEGGGKVFYGQRRSLRIALLPQTHPKLDPCHSPLRISTDAQHPTEPCPVEEI